MINFNIEDPNQLLINPRISDFEKADIQKLKIEFEKQFGGNGYFLIPSSGSTQKSTDSIKLVALSCTSILNSARRFNNFFNATAVDRWGLVLPEFHIAGLSIYARAFLAGTRIFKNEWRVVSLNQWIEKNEIAFLSLVPTQVYDIVQNKIVAPSSLKKVFIGAGSLSVELLKLAQSLKWPLIETYGMTETAAMIAYKKNERFHALPGVELTVQDGFLKIECDSLFKATLQRVSDQIQIFKNENTHFYLTQDRVNLTGHNEFEFLGRGTDYVKISGEGVSLLELNDKIKSIAQKVNSDPRFHELIFLDDERRGAKIVLVTDSMVGKSTQNDIIELYNLTCRPYEKIYQSILVSQIPRTDLGKLKKEELKSIVLSSLKKD